jgi:transcription initiation factor TFIID subunit 2
VSRQLLTEAFIQGVRFSEWSKILKTLERAEQSRKTKPVPTPVELEVDNAIASTIDLDPEESIRSQTQPPAPKLKLKLAGTSAQTSAQTSTPTLPLKVPKKLAKPSESKAIEKERNDTQSSRSSPDDFLLQEVIALERGQAVSSSRSDSGNRNKGRNSSSGTPKPTIKLKPPEPSTTESLPKPNGKEMTPGHTDQTTKKQNPKPLQQPINVKKAREILKVLRKLPEAIIFDRPVDPEKDGCPT